MIITNTSAAAEAPVTIDADNNSNPGVVLEGLDRPITGRGIFAVCTLGTAVSVESAFLAEDGQVLRLPAVFPNREYALQQIDELRQIVNQHFDAIDTPVAVIDTPSADVETPAAQIS